MLNVTPLQLTEVKALIVADGLIETVTVNTDPKQFPEIGVTLYVAVTILLVVLVNNPYILLIPVA